jgi:homoserine kinase
VPATINDFGPGIDSVALAVRLYHTVEMTGADTGFHLQVDPDIPPEETQEIAGAILSTVRSIAHKTRCTPSGLHAAVHQGELTGRGLGLDDGLALGCAIAVNSLVGGILDRTAIAHAVLELGTRPAPTMASLQGNIAIAMGNGTDAVYTVVAPAPLEIIVLLPDDPPEESRHAENPLDRAAAALLADALRTGNLALLRQMSMMTLRDRTLPDGWQAVKVVAQEDGAAALFVHSEARSAVMFARNKHDLIGQVAVEAYSNAAGSAAKYRIIPAETHGISIDAIDITADPSRPPISASLSPA